MEEKNVGSIKISEEVIAEIAIKAASEVDGVARVSQRMLDNAKKLITNYKTPLVKGIQIITGPEGLLLTLQIHVYAGRPIPRVAEEVQRCVADAVSSMTGISVSGVNISVVGVMPEKSVPDGE